jgi:alpha-L-arabinofuranosidase
MNYFQKFHISFLAAVLLMPGKTSFLQAQSATVTIDLSRETGRLNPLLFGHNIEAGDPQFIFGDSSNPIPGQTGTGVWNPKTGQPVAAVLENGKGLGVKLLRFPGGCLVHNYRWKETIGPVENRPNFTFGVDEFLAFCHMMGAEPLMNISDYAASPQDAADLVEYLNSPADAGHPWGKKRADNGHAAPYHLRWFEMGNETDHGNHSMRPSAQWLPTEYASWFLECAGKMRAVDPSIQLGALTGTGTGPDDPWNKILLEKAGSQIDFVIVHTYAVGLMNDTSLPTDRLMRAAMAQGEQFEYWLRKYNELIRGITGRVIPLAITEYNAMYVQENPVPFRFSLAAALFSAEYLRILMQPDLHIGMANYWQWVNGYWGLFVGPQSPDESKPWKNMAVYYFFRLWAQHFGPRLLQPIVEATVLDFEGCLNTRPAHKDYSGGTANYTVQSGSQGGVHWEAVGLHDLTLQLSGFSGEGYPTCGILRPALPNRTYGLRFEARVAGTFPPGSRLGIGLVDQRGWDATHSGSALDGLEVASDWTSFSGGDMVTLPDCPGILILFRLQGFSSPSSARLEVRNFELIMADDFPPYGVVTAATSLSEDGSKLFAMLFNKHHQDSQTVELKLTNGGLLEVRRWEVTGPAMESTNLAGEVVRETVSGDLCPLISPQSLRLTLPPHSMTALEGVLSPRMNHTPRPTLRKR